MDYLKPGLHDFGWYLRREACTVMLVTGLAGLVVASGLYFQHRTSGEVTTEDATVVRFGGYPVETGSIPVVIVRTRDGATRQLRLP